ncbi:DUF6458 family protein [Actinomadura atramentaria]|uniref:DUF6458 family protein n=1 Tax=Actinomadura atramentaria TaxID=1990 RepID=UPI00035CFD9E|nr:DUF6458 family protein [Actinomadura atramentaria]
MGIGVSLAFMAIGAILAFAIRFDLSGINIHLVGAILILVGIASMVFTFAYTRPRRRAAQIVEVEPGPGGDTVFREERVVERPVSEVPTERVVERPVVEQPTVAEPVAERPVVERPAARRSPRRGGIRSQTPGVGNDPRYANDPGRQQDPDWENNPRPPR